MTTDATGDAQTHGPDRVLWATELPAEDAGELIARPDGGCLVATRRFLASVRPSGQIEWTVETGAGWPGSPALLADGSVVRRENHRLIVRDGTTGGVLASWVQPAGTGPAATPDGDLVHGRWTEQRGGELCKVGPAGTLRWSRPLTRRLGRAPLVHGRRIIVGDGAYLRAYDLDGTLLWIAGRAGFHLAGPADLAGLEARTAAKTGEAAAPILGLDDDLVVAELRWYTGSGWYLFDLQSATVDRLEPPIAIHPPLAPLRRPGQAPGLVFLGPAEQDADGTWRWAVVSLAAPGRVEWTAQSPLEPRMLMSDDAGRLFVITSPDLDRWRQYRDWYDLSRECAIRCLSPAGRELWTWYAPHPLTYRPAVGSAGEIYAAVPGTLWALRADDDRPEG